MIVSFHLFCCIRFVRLYMTSLLCNYIHLIMMFATTALSTRQMTCNGYHLRLFSGQRVVYGQSGSLARPAGMPPPYPSCLCPDISFINQVHPDETIASPSHITSEAIPSLLDITAPTCPRSLGRSLDQNYKRGVKMRGWRDWARGARQVSVRDALGSLLIST